MNCKDIHPILDLYVFSYMRTCAMYDTTVKTIGFDEIRVRYRSHRRSLIRDILIDQLGNSELKEYISSQSKRLVPEKDRAAFIEDLIEDLKELDQSRIAGLGITSEQLKKWLAKNHNLNF